MNIITAAINSFGKSFTCPLYQWDYGQILMITGITLPDAYEVNFAQGSDTCTVIGTADGVEIPDEYLQNASDIIAYLYLHTGETDGETVYELTIPVIARPEPSHEEPTPVQQSEIEQAIAALNGAVESAEAAAEAAQEAAESIPEHVLSYDAQTLTDEEKAQARANINASDVAYEIHNLKDGSANHSIRQTSSAQESSSYTIGEYASSFGRGTKSSGQASHAEGTLTVASGQSAHAEGVESTASGQSAHAEGSATASGNTAHAENNQTTASGSSAHSEGMYTVASGGASHSEGVSTTASGVGAHTHGEGTVANHRAQTAIGQYNIADPSTEVVGRRGNYVEIVGNGTSDNARSNARTLDWAGNETLAGKLTIGANAESANDVPSLAQVQSMIPSVPEEIYWVTYQSTTAQQIVTAISAGKYPVLHSYDSESGVRIIAPMTYSFDGAYTFECVQDSDFIRYKLSSGTWSMTRYRDHNVKYDSQSLTTSQKAQARTNIGAISSADIPTDVSAFVNDAGYITSAPVSSVNGQTGAVVIGNATTSANGLMSATDKANLDTLTDDYTSAMTALGV